MVKDIRIIYLSFKMSKKISTHRDYSQKLFFMPGPTAAIVHHGFSTSYTFYRHIYAYIYSMQRQLFLRQQKVNTQLSQTDFPTLTTQIFTDNFA